jgi:OOP family OmpA-OmpF porin
MKKIYFILFIGLVVFSISSQAQEYKNGIGIHFGGFDFYGPQTENYLPHKFKNPSTQKEELVLRWDPAVRVSFWHAFSQHLDATAALQVANVQYPTAKPDSNFIKAKEGNKYLRAAMPFAALDAKLNWSLLAKEKFIFSPYVGAGASYTLRQDIHGVDIPVGLGCNIRLSKGLYMNLESNYRLAITKKNQDHLFHSLGIMYYWKGSKVAKPVPPPPPPPAPPKPMAKDTDNDGVVDTLDQCPYHAGPKDKAGCPDKDNDGVYDFEDDCPNQKGLALYRGCPDTDGDGIIDREDKCPKEAGTKENQGCPEIKQEVIEKVNIAAKGVNFETGKAVLTETSFQQLDVIVETLKGDPNLNVDIEGHTDNRGKAEKNLVLSQERADVCKNYLMQKGISENRITSVGYGDMKPIADNSTEEGRAQNRRTEFLLKR